MRLRIFQRGSEEKPRNKRKTRNHFRIFGSADLCLQSLNCTITTLVTAISQRDKIYVKKEKSFSSETRFRLASMQLVILRLIRGMCVFC